jgi:predicted DNA-binding protein (MmcQ/YjbR family)
MKAKRISRDATGSFEMTEDECVEKVRLICGELPDSREKTSYGHAAFAVKRGIFAVVEIYGGELSLAIKAGFDRQQLLLTDPRFYRTPYIGKRGWVSLKINAAPVDWQEIAELVAHSHQQVCGL